MVDEKRMKELGRLTDDLEMKKHWVTLCIVAYDCADDGTELTDARGKLREATEAATEAEARVFEFVDLHLEDFS